METSMAQLEIPQALSKWIVAYRTVSEQEYDFYLRDLDINIISIKAEKAKDDNKYCGEVRFKINGFITATLAVPASVSYNSDKTVIKSLKEFLAFRVKHENRIINTN
jgi:hypothetical protein